jgi:hypothetical protein
VRDIHASIARGTQYTTPPTHSGAELDAQWQYMLRFRYMERISTHTRARGTSMVELVVAIGIMSMIFISLFAVFRAMAAFSVRNELSNTARLLAEEHIEMIRALPYDSIGTVGGIPSGTIPQIETITQSGFTFTRRTFIQYVDDAADGTDTSDTLAADYKRARVDVSYSYHNLTHHVPIIATIAPRSQESLEHAGVLRMVVVDAANNPVPSATVWVENSSIATTVDVTTFTNTDGMVSFPGAWEGTGYNITIEKAGYSEAGTYPVSIENTNPSPSPATVLENATTELYFRIDRLSELAVHTFAWPTLAVHHDTFADTVLLASTASTTATGSALTLTNPLGTYEPTGSALSVPFTPPTPTHWLYFTASTTKPAGTDVRFRLWYDNAGTQTLVPDSEIPQNTLGFASTSLHLAHLATSTYHTLAVEALLTTSDHTHTPSIDAWHLTAAQQAVPVSTQITLTGSKTIGADAALVSIPKYKETHTTDASGRWATTTMEWDAYTMTVPADKALVACPALPVALEPHTTYTQTLSVLPASDNALVVTVQDTFGTPLPYSTVTLLDTGETRPANACGVVYFDSLASGTYTTRAVAGAHHATSTITLVDDTTHITLTLTPQ